MFDCLYLISFLLLILNVTISTSTSSSSSTQKDATFIKSIPDWRWCVANIAKFYVPANPSSSTNEGNNANNANNREQQMTWSDEGYKLCGFKMISMITLQKEAFFSSSTSPSSATRRHTFVGDSTSLRAYATAVNEFFPTSRRIEVGKVAQAPAYLSTTATSSSFLAVSSSTSSSASSSSSPVSSSDDASTKQPPQGSDENDEESDGEPRKKPAKAKSVELRFVKLIHVSLWNNSVKQIFGDPASKPSAVEASSSFIGGGLVSFSLGNWDLNWKLQPTYKIPGLGKKNYANVMAYWSRNVQAMFDWLDENVLPPSRRRRRQRQSQRNDQENKGLSSGSAPSAPSSSTASSSSAASSASIISSPPIIIFKEQLTPNCNASRFEPRKLGKKVFNKRCRDFLVPTVIPMYRRVLAAVAWARGIPVVPVDFLVDARVCKMGDGIHLDSRCMLHEQQLLWNVYLLLKRRGIRQRKLSDEGGSGEGDEDHDELKSFFGSSKEPRVFLKAEEALTAQAFGNWWCSKPWRAENDPLCNEQQMKLIQEWKNTQSKTPSSASATTLNPNSKPSPTSSSSTKDSNSDPHAAGGESDGSDGDEGSVKSSQKPKVAENENNNNNNNNINDNNAAAAFAPPGIADIWTVILIVTVPVLAYVGLRSMSGSSIKNVVPVATDEEQT